MDAATICCLLAEAWAWLAVAAVATSEAALADLSADGMKPVLPESLARLEHLAYLEDTYMIIFLCLLYNNPLSLLYNKGLQ